MQKARVSSRIVMGRREMMPIPRSGLCSSNTSKSIVTEKPLSSKETAKFPNVQASVVIEYAVV